MALSLVAPWLVAAAVAASPAPLAIMVSDDDVTHVDHVFDAGMMRAVNADFDRLAERQQRFPDERTLRPFARRYVFADAQLAILVLPEAETTEHRLYLARPLAPAAALALGRTLLGADVSRAKLDRPSSRTARSLTYDIRFGVGADLTLRLNARGQVFLVETSFSGG